jgi:hypothetical protein
MLPPSKLLMDLRKEERKSQSNQRVFFEMDLSDWEITYKEITKVTTSARPTSSSKVKLALKLRYILEERMGKKFRFVKKDPHGSSQPSSSGHRRVTPSQNKPLENSQYQKDQQQFSKPKKPPPRLCYNCRQPRHYANACPNPKKDKSQRQNQNPGVDKGNLGKKSTIQLKQDQLNFMGNISIREHHPTFVLYFRISR